MSVFLPGAKQKIALTLAALGRGLQRNTSTGLVDAALSTDAGNIAVFGSDNGLYVPSKTSTGSTSTLPAVTTSDNNKLLQVVNGNWQAAAYAPPGLSLLKTEFFASTTLVSSGGGWAKAAGAKWVVILVVGGGGSGGTATSSNYGFSGGEPGSLEIWRGWASDLPATADIVVGAGGASTGTGGGSNDGSPSRFGQVVQALGGRGGNNGKYSQSGNVGVKILPLCSLRLGAPGTDAIYCRDADPTLFGPGAGGGQASNGFSGAGGAASAALPASTVAGGAAASSGGSVGNGKAAVSNDPYSFGSGGAGGFAGNGSAAIAGGAGGAPGGGGGAGYSGGNGTTANGSGARGEIRVLTYG